RRVLFRSAQAGVFCLARRALLDGGFFAQFFLVVRQLLLAQHFFELRAHLVQRREFHRAGVFDVDDVPAELGLYRLVVQLAFPQAVYRIGERLDIVGGRGPAQIATVGGAARVFRVFLGQVGELGFVALDLGEQVVGGLFVFNQDVADLVFHLAGLLLLDLVVFGLHLLVGDGVLLQVFGHQGAHQDALAGQLDFGLHIGLLGNAVFFGGLHEDLAVDHF